MVEVAPLGSGAVVAAAEDPGSALDWPTGAGGAPRRNRYPRPAAAAMPPSRTRPMIARVRGERRDRFTRLPPGLVRGGWLGRQGAGPRNGRRPPRTSGR